jgi:hypothetical protein
MNEMSLEINKKFLTDPLNFMQYTFKFEKNDFRFSTPDIFPATVFAIFIEIIFITRGSQEPV